MERSWQVSDFSKIKKGLFKFNESNYYIDFAEVFGNIYAATKSFSNYTKVWIL